VLEWKSRYVRSCTALFYIISPTGLGSEAWAAEVAACVWREGTCLTDLQSTFMALCTCSTPESLRFCQSAFGIAIMNVYLNKNEGRLGIVGLKLGSRLR
jgi:hypothetical protein